MQVQTALYTVEEFEDFLAEHGEDRYELIYGEIIEKKMPTEKHGIICLRIGARLLFFVEERQVKAHVGVEVRHQIPTDRHNSRLPDVSLRLSAAPAVEEGAVTTMPDLAVEVQSPDDRPSDMRQKADYYLRNGSRLVWLVYIASQSVEVCTLNSAGQLSIESLTQDDVLNGTDVLPEFTLPIKSIFNP